MKRALTLAALARGNVSPNPMVGCVIVQNAQIIGEGFHAEYGEAHAEVNAVRDAIGKGHEHLLAGSTVYVTLEPCSHFGKTPPCADLLISSGVKRVVICNPDPNPLVAGSGVEKLKANGVSVELGVLAEEGELLNRRFFNFFRRQRPYVILKWAETRDSFIAKEDGSPVRISGTLSDMMVHKWRSEEDSILVGKQTVIHDNPSLNVRHWQGRNPVRLLMDRRLTVTEDHRVYDLTQPLVVYNYLRGTVVETSVVRYAETEVYPVHFAKITPGSDEIGQVLSDLYHRKIQSVLVEGGRTILETFIQSGHWDEIRRCQGNQTLEKGIPAPTPAGRLVSTEAIEDDLWSYYVNRPVR